MHKAMIGLLALLLTFGLAPLGSTPAYAATGSASPSEAAPGTRVHFSASGFTPGERLDFWASAPDSSVRPRYPSVNADANGAAQWSWDVGAGDANGAWSMTARGIRSDTRVVIPFTVVGSAPAPSTTVGVAPPSGAPGTSFSFNAGGFAAEEKISAYLVEPNGRGRDLVPGQDPGLVADKTGNLAWSWTAPADVASGQWKIVVEGRSSKRKVEGTFSITATTAAAPVRSVAPSAGPPGTTFAVVVGGLRPNEQVGSWLNAPNGQRYDAVPYLVADPNGLVSWNWPSPANAQAGTWQAVTYGRDSKTEVVLSLTVTGSNAAPTPAPSPTSGSVSPASGAVGTRFSFSVTGFGRFEYLGFYPTRPDGSVQETRLDPVKTDGEGRATIVWQAPPRIPAGAWVMNIEGRDSDRRLVVPFTIVADEQTPGASVSPSEGVPGTSFAFRASGFNQIEFVNTWLELPDGSQRDGPKGVRANGKGVAEWSWTAPADAVGGRWIMVVRGKDSELTFRVPITIKRDAPPPAQASVAPERGAPGTTFVFNAGGFLRGERVGYWLNLPDGSVQRFDKELRADAAGQVSWSYSVPANGQRGQYVMALRSSQSDAIEHDVAYDIRFSVE